MKWFYRITYSFKYWLQDLLPPKKYYIAVNTNFEELCYLYRVNKQKVKVSNKEQELFVVRDPYSNWSYATDDFNKIIRFIAIHETVVVSHIDFFALKDWGKIDDLPRSHEQSNIIWDIEYRFKRSYNMSNKYYRNPLDLFINVPKWPHDIKWIDVITKSNLFI